MTKQICNATKDAELQGGTELNVIYDIMISKEDLDHCVEAYMHVYTILKFCVLMLRGKDILYKCIRQFGVWDAIGNASYSVL